MARVRGPGEGQPADPIDTPMSRSADAVPGCIARVVVAVVDDRPIALVFPASRRVVLERLRKLLAADEVRLAPCEEAAGFLGDPPPGTAGQSPGLPGGPLLMDASLLSARALEIRRCGEEGSVRWAIEDWLAAANPILGFFTEPARPHDG